MKEAFDSHCHLQDAAFDDDREAVYEAAHTHGLGLIVPGYSRSSSAAAVEFSETHPGAWALVGVHPHDASAFSNDDESLLRQWLCRPHVVGMGEIGLDYHYDLSPRDVQREVFQRQLILAREVGAAVAIHSREAEADTLAAIDQVPGIRGVLHCFTGSLAFAEALLARGWMISFSGVVTFASAGALREVVRRVPLERMLVETDAPYLAPVPFRGRRNQPLWVEQVAVAVAEQKKCTEKEVFRQSTENIYQVFSFCDPNW